MSAVDPFRSFASFNGKIEKKQELIFLQCYRLQHVAVNKSSPRETFSRGQTDTICSNRNGRNFARREHRVRIYLTIPYRFNFDHFLCLARK